MQTPFIRCSGTSYSKHLHHFLHVLRTSRVSARSIATVTTGFSPESVKAEVLGGGDTDVAAVSVPTAAPSGEEARKRFDE